MKDGCMLPGSAVIGWYLGAVVLDVLRGARVRDNLMHTILHVRTLLECNRRQPVKCWY
jgi:hypothetical protein